MTIVSDSFVCFHKGEGVASSETAEERISKVDRVVAHIACGFRVLKGKGLALLALPGQPEQKPQPVASDHKLMSLRDMENLAFVTRRRY